MKQFVAMDADGTEVDWVDPYEGHKQIKRNLYLVRNPFGEHEVIVPEGGRFEIVPMTEEHQ